MSNREAHSRIASPPVVTDRAGRRRLAKCPLCDDPLAFRPSAWYHLPSDPPDLRRPVHIYCATQLDLFLRAMQRRAEQVTPAF